MSSMNDRGAWFAPKRIGFGSSLPIAWQGWVAVAAYLGAVAGASLLSHKSMTGFVVILVGATLVFGIICARHTKGGWRWRDGSERDER